MVCWRVDPGAPSGYRDSDGFGGQWGQYTDPETGLLCLTNRYYDPGTGRFLNRDPIGYGGGVNLYAYAGNNPVTGIDPSGLQSVMGEGSQAQNGRPAKPKRSLAWYIWDSIVNPPPAVPLGDLAPKFVVLDTNVVYQYAKELKTGSGPLITAMGNDKPAITKTILAELRNNAARGKMGMPRASVMEKITVLDDNVDVVQASVIRGMIVGPKLVRNVRGLLGDGRIGSTVLQRNYRLLTSDKRLYDVLVELQAQVIRIIEK